MSRDEPPQQPTLAQRLFKQWVAPAPDRENKDTEVELTSRRPRNKPKSSEQVESFAERTYDSQANKAVKQRSHDAQVRDVVRVTNARIDRDNEGKRPDKREPHITEADVDLSMPSRRKGKSNPSISSVATTAESSLSSDSGEFDISEQRAKATRELNRPEGSRGERPVGPIFDQVGKAPSPRGAGRSVTSGQSEALKKLNAKGPEHIESIKKAALEKVVPQQRDVVALEVYPLGGHVVRDTAALKAAAEQAAKDESGVKAVKSLQAGFRGRSSRRPEGVVDKVVQEEHASRREAESKAAAATLITKVAKGYIARKEVDNKKVVEGGAAQVIQKAFRGVSGNGPEESGAAEFSSEYRVTGNGDKENVAPRNEEVSNGAATSNVETKQPVSDLGKAVLKEFGAGGDRVGGEAIASSGEAYDAGKVMGNKMDRLLNKFKEPGEGQLNTGERTIAALIVKEYGAIEGVTIDENGKYKSSGEEGEGVQTEAASDKKNGS